MAYDPDDYDEVYETKSEPERAQLVANGWVLLDERIEQAGGKAHESFLKEWFGTAFHDGSSGGFHGWSGAARNTAEPQAPPQDQTTYVLGWPKGQQTIGEDEAEAQDGSRTVADTGVAATSESSIEQPGPPDSSDSPTAPSAPTAPEGMDDTI